VAPTRRRSMGTYSRRADLGAGLVVYPIEGIGAALLTIAAAVTSYLDGNSCRGVALPMYCAAAVSVAGLLLTIKAAPTMLGLATPQPAAAIQRAFDEFFVWGLYLRGSADTFSISYSGLGALQPVPGRQVSALCAYDQGKKS
jgi:hypothetical protein